MTVRPRPTLAAIGLALLLGACSETLPASPRINTQAGLEQLTRYVPGRPATPANELYKVAITDNAIKCEYSDVKFMSARIDPASEDTMECWLKITFSAVRGPAATGNQAEVQYLVAVTDLRKIILNKEVLTARIDLPSRPGIVSNTTEQTWMLFRLGGRTGLAFRIWTGLQPSERELEYNQGLTDN